MNQRFAVGLFLTGVLMVRAAPSPEEIAALAAAAAAIPAREFFRNAEVIDPKISPDGTKIAFLFPSEDRRMVGVYDRATREAKRVLFGPKDSLDSIIWKGNEHLIVYARYHGIKWPDTILTDLDGKKIVKLNDRYGVGRIVDARPWDPVHIVAHAFDSSVYGYIGLFNVFSGHREEMFPNRELEPHTGFGLSRTDGAGVVRFTCGLRDRQLFLLYRDYREQPFSELLRWPLHGYDDVVEDIQAVADGSAAFAILRTQNDRGALYRFDTSSRRWSDALFVPPEGEIQALLFSYDRTKFYGVSFEADRQGYKWFDEDRAKLQAGIEAAFPGLLVDVVSTSADEQTMIVVVHSDREAGGFFVLDRKTKSMALFKRRMPGLDARLMRPMEPITYRARDGLELHGYLTRPWRALGGEKVPLIVHPHGGPFGVRDSWDFDPEVQFLVSRGYAVLQVNYRGSGGYGQTFLDKGKAQWGRAMQDDLTDGVHWALSQGNFDPKRVAIYGGSYGGYAALAGVTLTPDLYCCAANYIGAADLEITFHYRGSDAYSFSDSFDFRDEWVGPNKNYRRETSPIEMIDRIRVPTFHAYSKNDPVIEFDHWIRLKRQLEKYHKPYEFLIETEQGHGFDAGQASVEYFERLEKFLAAQLKPN